MIERNFNYKRLRLAQDLNKTTRGKLALKLAKHNAELGRFELPSDDEVTTYINKLAEQQEIVHYVLQGVNARVVLFDPSELEASCEFERIEGPQTEVVCVYVHGEKPSDEDNVPYSISAVADLLKLPIEAIQSGPR